ncbi:hypothetical protein ElyMa_003801700 [Elysia marginata]|uniref:Uncharacterized protein n=1 Tax=Elysia marginata TaxID=1093978 RepID=A0AAV4FDR5_9GAST|nr:hypothetical protein ElyMa_003801700 [Elysia marginata]
MKKQYLGCFVASLILLSGCSLNLVAPYDPQTIQQLKSIDRQIELFYRSMQAMEESERQYQWYTEQYFEIDINIRALERRQARRENNQETLEQTQILAQLWQQDMKAHQRKDVLSDFLIKRRQEQYRQLIDTILRGEFAKR